MNFGYRTTFQLIDKGNIEVFGPAGIAFNAQQAAKGFSKQQSGTVSNYAFYLMLFVLIVLCIFLTVAFSFNALPRSESLIVVLFGYAIFCFIV
jgi:hypothetical protein